MIDVPVFLTEPAYDGLYICYTDNDALPAFTDRKLLMKYQGEWTYPMSDQKFRGRIYGWVGPLPVLKKEHFLKPTAREHVYFKCPGTKPECIEGRCVYCNGGLSYCTVCQQGEAELEPTCPGPKREYDL